MKKINAKEVKAGEVVDKLTEDEIRVVRRAKCKIDATKSVIETLTNDISREYEVIRDLWRKYDYPEEVDTELARRGLTISMNERTGEIRVTVVSDSELKKALFHGLLW